MAHSAVIVTELEPNELICPFVVVKKDSDMQSLEFESEPQEKSITDAWEKGMDGAVVFTYPFRPRSRALELLGPL